MQTTRSLLSLLLVIFVFGAALQAQDAPTSPSASTLKNSILKTSTAGSAQCNNAYGCIAHSQLYSQDVICPSKGTCTFYIHIDSQVSVSQCDKGMFGFWVDSAAPTPGPTDSDGYFSWIANWCSSDRPNYWTASSSVVSQVANTTVNQSHTVRVDIGCQDFTPGNSFCSVNAGPSTLKIDVYKP